MLERCEAVGNLLRAVCERARLVGMRVVLSPVPGARRRGSGSRRGAARRARRAAVRSRSRGTSPSCCSAPGRRRRRTGRAGAAADRPAPIVSLAFVRNGSAGSDEPAERADRILEQHARDVPDVVRVEAVVGRVRQRRDRDAGRRERRHQRRVEREPLHRVVVVADHVEQPAEPAGRLARVERADLPEVARGEVRLVGVVVADRREDGQPPVRRAGARATRRTGASGAASRPRTSARRRP